MPTQSEQKKAAIGGLKKTVKIPDLASIKQSLSQQDQKSTENPLLIGRDAVTVNRLKAEWNNFADKLKQEGRDREYNTLNQQVEFHENLTINLTLPNSFQALTIEGVQQELLTTLRTNLNNKDIQLITEVEKVENKKMIYTASEKFEYLAEKYPNLRELRKRLDLDTDF